MAESILSDGTKWCPKCQTSKPCSEFWRNKKNPGGLQTYCKPCCYLYQRQWDAANADKKAEWTRQYHLRNPNRVKEYQRKNKDKAALWRKCRDFGITKEQYAALVERSGGACEICGARPKSVMSLHTDHCHQTGQVRGLLCKGCNNGLGFLGDSIEGLLRAVEYLRKHECRDSE